MSFAFTHLDTTTRRLMLSEIDSDLTAGSLYVSERLSPSRPSCLWTAIEGGRTVRATRFG